MYIGVDLGSRTVKMAVWDGERLVDHQIAELDFMRIACRDPDDRGEGEGRGKCDLIDEFHGTDLDGMRGLAGLPCIANDDG